MMKSFFSFAISLFIAGANVAHATDIAVVKIASFSCPVCFASESIDVSIREAAKAEGAQFVFAPVPNSDQDSGYKERLYYASRKFDIQNQIRSSMYKGTQEVSVPLNEWAEIQTWIQSDPNLKQIQKESLAALTEASKKEAETSIRKAIQLAVRGGVTSLPAYLILIDGNIKATLDPSVVQNGSLTALKDAVISKIQSKK